MRSLVLFLITARLLFGIWSNLSPAKVAGQPKAHRTVIALDR